MRRTYLFILLAVPLMLLPLACTPPVNPFAEAKPGQKKILVSFPPLYALAHAVAGEDGYVVSMLTGEGPHGYHYSAHDLLKVNKADLLIYNGLELDEQFVDRLKDTNRNPSLVYLNIGKVMDKKHHDLLLHGEHEHEAEEGKDDKDAHKHDHKHGEHDPHIWLGPKQAMAMTKIIASKLSEIDPDRAKKYEKRADDFVKKLEKLEADGRAALKGKKIKMVTMHESLGYFADAFDIEIVGAIQKLPGTDPDSASRAKLVKLCKEKKVTLIAIEPQYLGTQAESLQATLKKDGVDVQIITVDPLETVKLEGNRSNPDPAYYLTKMKENIDAIVKAAP